MERLTIDDMKSIELEIADEIDRMCREHGVGYFLAYGSLLGAARHGGFIPWDDDMDIAMLRADYERFAAHFREWRSSERFDILDCRRGKSIFPFLKVVDTTTRVQENFTAKGISNGVWVDVFPLDAVPKDAAALFKRRNRLDLLRNFIVADPTVGSSALAKLAKRIVCPFVSHLDASEYARRVDACGKEADARARASADEATGMVADIVAEGTPERTYDEALFEPIEMAFEDRSYLAPAGFERMLEIQYGDWRTPPAENDRAVHTFEAYRL